jgi:N-acetylglucosaminyl-diphospho-decaprenol L-rhamnosyltransferase
VSRADPGEGRATLAVIVVSYKVRELLAACLAATYASLALCPDLDATVWVVDNASGDGSAEMVAAEFPQARLLASADNLGFAGGNNLVLAELGFTANQPPRFSPSPKVTQPRRSEPNPPHFVLLLNPDAEPVGDAIGQMARFLSANRRAGGAGAQLQYPDGRFQHGAFAFPGLLQLWFDLFPPRPARLLDSRLNGRYRRSLYEAGAPFPIDFGLGASLMVRREAIESAGLLDEGYFMYAEEVDWCWRIQLAGWPFYCVPAARVIHHGGASTRQFRSESVLNLWRSRRKLYARFYGPVKRFLAAQIVHLGMKTEARRAKAACRCGQISTAEEQERIATADAVRRLFARGETR